MLYHVDRTNPHINYEPSTIGGLREVVQEEKDHEPYVAGNVVRQKIDRTNDFKQAGERYRMFEDWERDDLIENLVNALRVCRKEIQDKMIEMLTKCDPDYGRRVREGLEQAGSKDSGKLGTGGPIGTENAGAAVKEAERKGHQADPY